jgi:hypothetical protein
MGVLLRSVSAVAFFLFLSSPAQAQGQNLFFVPPTFPGSGQRVMADFNGDGKLDLISSDGTVLLGNGDGTFTQGTSIGAHDFIGTADFNGDGKPDLVVTSASTNTFSVLLGKGDGTFQSPIVTAVSSPLSSLLVGDLNGDGKPDVLALPNLSTTFFSYLGKGDGTFAAGVNSGVQAVTLLADFNGDHKLDVVFSGGVQLGKGDGTFQAVLPFTVGTFAPTAYEALGDFNGDGKLDLVISAAGTAAAPPLTQVLLGKGDGTFQAPVQVGNTGGFVAAGDVNGDGKADLVIEAFPFVQAFLSNGDGTFKAEPINSLDVTGFPPGDTPLAGDFNGDGKVDLAVSNTMLLGNGDGTFQADLGIPSVGETGISADLNGDKLPDLVLLTVPQTSPSETMDIWLNDGKGGLTLAHTYSVPLSFALGAVDAVGAAVDLNGDGKVDLALYSTIVRLGGGPWGLIVMLGNGDGSFGAPITMAGSGSGSVTGFVVADLNGDKKPDIIVVVSGPGLLGSGSVFVFLGNGDGTFQAPVQYFAGNSDGNVVAADFNKDGKMDIAVGTSNGIALLLGNGDGTFQPATIIASNLGSNYSRWLVTADLNGDGSPDLIASGTSAFQVFLGKGDGTFNALTPVVDSTNSVLPLVDFNGDGKLDALCFAGAALGFRLGNGDGTFGNFLPVVPTLAPSTFEAVSDFNGDGRPDLALINSGLTWLFNTGKQLTPDFQLSASALSPASVAPGSSTTASLTLTPTGGFNGSVAFTCSGLPSGAKCNFTTSSMPTGTTATLTISTTAPSMALLIPSRFDSLGRADQLTPIILSLLAMTMAWCLYLWHRNQRTRWAPVLAIAVLICIGMTITACGGGSSGGSGGGGGGGGGSTSTGTPAGSYPIVVSASAISGSTTLTHTTQLTLVVQ